MKRSCGMLLRLTKTEMDMLTKKARKAHMSREGFCRNILNGAEVREAPSVDVTSMIWELRRVGNNINQLLVKADAVGFIDTSGLCKALDETHAVEDKLMEAYTTQAV